MTGLLTQFGVVDEVTYGTPVTVSRFFEVDNPVIITPQTGRTTNNALRAGTRAPRSTMFSPFMMGGSASVSMPVPTKGWGWWLKHMLGAVATGAVADSNYTHTGSVASLTGDSFTAQSGEPFVSGTVQAFTGHGGKITSWSLACDVEGLLQFTADMDFEDVATDIALATASYPAGALVFGWASAAITFDGGSVDLSSFSVSCDNPLNTARRYLRGSTLKKEPIEEGLRNITWEATAEFENLTMYNKWVASTPSGTQAAIVATFDGPIAHAGATLPQVVITIPVARVDNAVPAGTGAAILTQTFSGIAMDNGTDSPITIAYRSPDTTP